MDKDGLLDALTSEQGNTLIAFCVEQMIELSETSVDPNCVKGMGMLIGKITAKRDSLKKQQQKKD